MLLNSDLVFGTMPLGSIRNVFKVHLNSTDINSKKPGGMVNLKVEIDRTLYLSPYSNYKIHIVFLRGKKPL